MEQLDKHRQYAHLYESRTTDPEQKTEDTAENAYLYDLKEIETICTDNDLEDMASNDRLYQRLRKGHIFSTWIGEAFLTGLSDRTKRRRRRETLQKVCRRIAVSFLVMAVVLLAVLLCFQIKKEREDAVLTYIRQEKEQLKKSADTGTKSRDNLAILDEYGILYSMYPDVVGWISVEGTQIDYPVMQDKTGEEYYLTHNFEGREDNKGAPFIEADSCIEPRDQNIVIFGHNVRGGSQFGDLDRYLEKDFYDKHPTIQFDTIYEQGTYQIVAVVKTQVKKEEESGFRYYWFRNYANRQEFQELLDFVKENRVYDTGEYLQYGDTTIMLSTCEYTADNGRLVVIAKRV
ncbi:MAG: class B sortase [Lachnospiraceae bacterium]|nr:class B sortase [Lachnospiraceae bacterium]